MEMISSAATNKYKTNTTTALCTDTMETNNIEKLQSQLHDTKPFEYNELGKEKISASSNVAISGEDVKNKDMNG